MTNSENSYPQIITSKARADKAINLLERILPGVISEDLIRVQGFEEKKLQIFH